MAQDLQKNPVVNLSRGLVTEQTPLTPVDNSTTDELNMDIALDGSRHSRKGLSYLSNRTGDHPASESALLHGIDETETYPDVGSWSSFYWENPGNIAGVSVMVVQSEDSSGPQLTLIPSNNLFDSDNSKRSVTIVRSDTSKTVGVMDYTVINGKLVVSAENMDPIYIKLTFSSDGSAPYFSMTHGGSTILLRIRDFKTLGADKTALDTNTSPTDEDKYDAFNAGWTVSARDDFGTGTGTSTDYPPLTQRWHSTKESDGTFDYSAFVESDRGTTRISGGRFVIAAHMNIGSVAPTRSDQLERTLTGSTTGADAIETANTEYNVGDPRLKHCESFAGRVFYAGHPHPDLTDSVLFSQVVNTEFDLPLCYQVNDPTSEILSDPVDSDGGVITINGMSGCTALKSFGDSLLVFSNNGVWSISPGSSGVFSATSYRVNKVSEHGTDSFRSLVLVEDTLLYVNRYGINAISKDLNNNFTHENISRRSIQKYWSENYETLTHDVIGCYDPLNKQVHWLFSEQQDSIRSKCLVLDIANNAFLPWEFDRSLKIRSASYFVPNYTDNATSFSDFGNSNLVSQELSRIIYVVKDDAVLPDDTMLTVEGVDFTEQTWNFADLTFPINVDLKTFATGDTDTTFSCYLETPPNFYGDMHNDKNNKEVIVYTEKDSRFYFPFPDNYSSDSVETETRIKIKHSWDFEDFENAQNAYEPYDAERIETTPAGTVGDTDYVFHKNISIKSVKFRGRGKALRIRLESDDVYPIKFIGYSDISSRDRDYDR